MPFRSTERILLQLAIVLCLLPTAHMLAGPPSGLEGRDIDNILPERARADLVNRWLEWRLDNILPRIMRRANQVADIFLAEFRAGRTGLDIVSSAMKKAEAAGLRPLIYSHPLGFHGHGAGCIMDARPRGDAPEGILERMNCPLYPDTAYAVEFSSTASVPEWGGRDVRIAYEETAVFTAEGCRFADGRQERLVLIKP